MMEDAVIPTNTRFARKRTRHPEKWKRNIAKKARYSPKTLPERVLCNHNTKSFRCSTLSMNDLLEVHKAFFQTPSKLHQDGLILKWCTPTKVKANSKGKKTFTTKYSVYNKTTKKKTPVCREFFIKTLGITKYRVQNVMRQYYESGEFPKEKRGGNQKARKFEQQRIAINSFLQSLQCIESHYCRKTKFAERKYFPSTLNIMKLFKMFQEHPIYGNQNVKRSYFRHVFNTNYNIGFGTPKTDACSTCLELNEKIKSETDPIKKNNLLVQKRVHSLRAKTFFKVLAKEIPEVKTISFDCQKNLVLPKVPDQSAYYSRQLYYHNFTIVEGTSKAELSQETVFAYHWTENEYNKNTNLIASALYDRLINTDLTNIKKILLFADGCGGQNKNSIIIGMLSKWLLTNQNIDTVEIVFPVTGHSFMPADRFFGIAEKKIRTKDTIIHPSEYSEILEDKATTIKVGEQCPVYEWRDALRSVVKLPGLWNVPFSQCKRFKLKRNRNSENVLVKGELHYVSDLGKYFNICRKEKTIADIVPIPLPKEVALNKNKLQDINKLLCKHFGDKWKELDCLEFYVNLFDSQSNLHPNADRDSELCEGNEEVPDLRI